MDKGWLHFVDHVVDVAVRSRRVRGSNETRPRYMQWFCRILHPCLIPPQEGESPRGPTREPIRMPESSFSSGSQSATVSVRF